jgi:acetyltransferase-like isoleucine patch superfamily enzyme
MEHMVESQLAVDLPETSEIVTWQSSIASGIRQLMANPGLSCQLLNAQLQLRRKARVPASVRLTGRVKVAGGGEVILGRGVSLVGDIVPVELLAHAPGRVVIGDHTAINYGTSISAHSLVSIGQNCLLGHYCFIIDNDHHMVNDHYMLPPAKPVIIEDRVWIGTRVVVLPGVHIGHDSVIGAGSVVMKDIPPFSVATGHPARVVRSV